MVQACSSAPDVASQANHCAVLGVKVLTVLEVSGFFSPPYLMQILETIQGNIPLPPLAM